MELEKLIKELEKLGYVCIPKKEYKALKEELEELRKDYECALSELAGEDW